MAKQISLGRVARIMALVEEDKIIRYSSRQVGSDSSEYKTNVSWERAIWEKSWIGLSKSYHKYRWQVHLY